MADVFISYAKEDRPAAQVLARRLSDAGWDVWWDADLVAGREFDQAIEHELRAAKAVIVLWSPASVTSRWVRSEASVAADRGVMVPVLLGGTALPLQFSTIQAVDLSDWTGDATAPAFMAIATAVRSLIQGSQPVVPPPAPRPLVASDPAAPHAPSTPVRQAAPRRGRWLAMVGAVALVGAAIAVAIIASDGDRDDTTPTAETSRWHDCPDVLRHDCAGDMVRELQNLLMAIGNDPGPIDGRFGDRTEHALRSFQADEGFDVTGEIVVDDAVWNLLVQRATEPTVLQAPALLAPPDGAVFDFYPRATELRWESVDVATSYLVEVEYEAGPDLWESLVSEMTSNTTFHFDFVGAQRGRWRVTALDESGSIEPSSPTDWWTFTYTV